MGKVHEQGRKEWEEGEESPDEGEEEAKVPSQRERQAASISAVPGSTSTACT